MRDLIEEPSPGATAALVCFTGYIPDITKSEDFFEFRQSTSQLTTMSRFYIRDRHNDWYCNGCTSIPRGASGLEEYLASVRRLHTRLAVVGNSMGGYAALRYGCSIGADLVIAVSPQSYISTGARERTGDIRWPADMARINAADQAIDISNSATWRPDTTLIFHANDPLDLTHVEQFRGSPATIIPLNEDARHETAAAWLRDAGIINGAISALERGEDPISRVLSSLPRAMTAD